MKTIQLSEEVVQKRLGNEATVIRNALRGHATEYERRSKHHEDRDATMAAWIYMVEANVIRNVLKREFGDE